MGNIDGSLILPQASKQKILQKNLKVIFIKKDKEIDIVNIQLKINGKNDSFKY